MEKNEFYKQVCKHAVRIGIDDCQCSLQGSGTLLVSRQEKRAFVLTAAHVVVLLKKKLQNNENVIHINCTDMKDEEHEIRVKDINNIYVHPGYNKKQEQDYLYDAAMIEIPWETWMEDIEEYVLQTGEIGNDVVGYGYPEALDNERNKVTKVAGVKKFTGSIDVKIADRNAISYNPDNIEGGLTRECMMKGFSGTGLFVNGGDKFIFQGTISCSRGERSAGTQLWAIDTKQYFELMREFGINSIFEKQDIENEYNKNDFPKKKKRSKGIYICLLFLAGIVGFIAIRCLMLSEYSNQSKEIAVHRFIGQQIQESVSDIVNIYSLSQSDSELIEEVKDKNEIFYYDGEVKQGLGSDGNMYEWYKITTESGITGWIRKDLVIMESNAYYVRCLRKNVEDILNIRSLPQHDSELVGEIKDKNEVLYYNGEVGKGLGSDGAMHEWYRIVSETGKAGWVRKDLVMVDLDAQSVKCFRKEVEGTLNIRSHPQYESELVGTVEDENEMLYFNGEVGQGFGSDGIMHEWYKIITETGKKGWVRNDLVREEDR